MNKQPSSSPAMELLAPAGSFGAFKAAMDEGADAIYVGAPDLNARALSRDFSYPEIAALTRSAHRKGVKLYIAMNSLVKEDEVEKAVTGLARFEKIGVDAVIIQDLGLLQLARTYFPKLPLHASTLMAAHNSPVVKKFTEFGMKRVVLPREFTIAEIQEVRKQTGAELEVFVHGAMCFSYSGLCLFSSMFGGKSSLRGQCVQPCRRRYNWQKKKGFVKQGKLSEKDGGYLFSMHDLSGIEFLSKLQEAGVASLKIEGRLKSAEYVRKVVRAYRLVLNNLHDKNALKSAQKEARVYLEEAMGRKRSPGFFLSSKPGEAVTPTLSGNIGLPVGKITKLDEKGGGKRGVQTTLMVELIRDIAVGDRLRLHDDRSGERKAFTLHVLVGGGRNVKSARAGQKVKIVCDEKIRKSRSGSFKGSLFKVDIASGRDEEHRARVSLIGKKTASVEHDQARVKKIMAELASTKKRGAHKQDPRDSKKLPIWIGIRSLRDRQFSLPVKPAKYLIPVSLENMELLRHAPAKLRKRDGEIVWSFPPVIHNERVEWYVQTVADLVQQGFTTFQLGHISQVSLFDEFQETREGIELYGSYTCNILNSSGLDMGRNLRLKGLQFSLETDAENLRSAIANFRNREDHLSVGLYVYGHPPLFTARLADSRYRYGKRFVSPRGEVFALERDNDLTRARAILPFSLLDVRQELARDGVDYLVADLSFGNMKKNLADFSSLFRGRNKNIQVLAGNYRAGLL